MAEATNSLTVEIYW